MPSLEMGASRSKGGIQDSTEASRIRSVRKGSSETRSISTVRPPGGGGLERSREPDSTVMCSPGMGRPPPWGTSLKMRDLLLVVMVMGFRKARLSWRYCIIDGLMRLIFEVDV